MNVAVVTASTSRAAGGLFDAVRRPAQLLVLSHGVDVRVYAPEDDFSGVDQEAWVPARVSTFARRGPSSFGYAPELQFALDEAEPQLLHSHGLWQYPSVVARAWSHRTKRPCVVSPHGMLDPWALCNSRLKKMLAMALFERSHLEGAACIHALCAAEVDAIRRLGLRRPVAVIPNGVDLPDLEPDNRPGIGSSRRRTLLFLSRLHPKKGLLPLLRGWAEARRIEPARSSGWQLTIAGWGDEGYVTQLRRAAEELGILDSVRFIGPVFGEAKSNAFREADAFILPSLSEGLPMAVLEAWSYRLPVLMTSECNLPDGFDAEAALRILATPNSITQGLLSLWELGDKELVSMGRKGRSLVEDRFTWPMVASQLRRLYEWLTAAGTPPEFIQQDSVR